MKANNITQLIVDLRYNGGGYISLAQELAEIIIPAEKTGEEFFTAIHNDNVSSNYDTTFYFSENELNLDLDRVFFITTSRSASASELVINSLEPYMEVITIGSSTHGKPVGMYSFYFQDWLFAPVTIQLINSDGYGDYFNGLPPDCIAEDGLDKSWGDETESSLSQAFHYISFGIFDNTLIATTKSSEKVLRRTNDWNKQELLLLDR
ncbi:hypothetical protein ES705_10869 [subsurface metagenome]